MTVAITIPAGEALSSAVDLSQTKPTALIAPPEWTGGAPLSFQMSPDNVTFHPVSHWSTTEIFTIPVVPDHWVPLDSQVFKAAYMKIHSGHPVSPIPQEADRTFLLVMS